MNDVDTLIQQTPFGLVLHRYGLPEVDSHATEYRMACVFNEACAEDRYGNLNVKLDSAKRIYCHSCQTKGNLLTLIHGLEKHAPPEGGRLRGQEFKDAVSKLREISGTVENVEDIASAPVVSKPVKPSSASEDKVTSVPVNIPLRRHEKEPARALANLYEELVNEVAGMSPAAAAYVRSRPWMTPELMSKWGVGWIPGDGRSLFRKNYLAYTHRNERSEVVSYSGRDLSFVEKHEKWLRHGKPDGKKPGKHRYVAGFHRGVELYGGHADRIREPHVAESLQQHGIVIVEGMNEVLRLDALGVAAVGLGSNRVTAHQLEKLIRFAQSAGNNRAVLLPDCDEEGETGFKELLWKLAESGVAVGLGCSRQMFNGAFEGRQPESYSEDDWQLIAKNLQRSPSALS